eukprot:5299423-Lingulodinium_polyedra.AAC.1
MYAAQGPAGIQRPAPMPRAALPSRTRCGTSSPVSGSISARSCGSPWCWRQPSSQTTRCCKG